MNTENLPTWNLNDLYPGIDSPELINDIEKLQISAQEFAKKYDGRIEALSGDDLAAALAVYEEIQDLSARIGTYAQLVFAGDMLAEENSTFYQNTSDKIRDIHSNLLFFTLALNKISDADLNAKLKSEKLAKYSPWIRDLRAFKPYQLSDELEKFDLDKSSTSSAWVRLFEETHANLKYNYDGAELTNSEIFDKMSDKNPATREKAAHTIAKTLGDNIRIFTLVTNTLAKDKSVEDKWRGFERPISSRNLSNLVEDEVVASLISAVKQNYKNLAHRYYKIKAKWLGLEKLKYWDRNAPLPESDDEYIPYEKAKNIVLNAYREFSPQMAEIGQKFFDHNWIDVPPRKGKDSGAFSHPSSVSTHPYILLNYQGKIRDVMTLAHELGHGVHQYLSRGQGALMSDTPLTLAETASVFGEQLVFRSILNSLPAEKKKIMIAEKIEDMLNTVVRQIAFCEFEREVHNLRKEGELSSEAIGEIWMRCQAESLGDAFNFDEEYKYFWSYISHFIHTPFYVYAYAFGDCLVNSLYAVYLSGMPGFQEKYIKMLLAGGTLRHKELLEPFGLDASKPDFWQKGLDIIADFISQLEK
jgi:oligoendopeptidase F